MYQQIIDSAILARNAKRQEERGSDEGEWHPSSLSGCERAAVYAYNGEPKSDPKDIRSIRIMDRGTEIHEDLQAMFIRALVEADAQPSQYLPEVKVDFGGVKGSADALLNISEKEDPLYELQEYKSISTKGAYFLKGQPKPEASKQARIYHWALERMGYLMSADIRVVYIDRDDWTVKGEFEIPAWDIREIQDWEQRLTELEDHVYNGTLPDQMPDDYWLCRYCDWRTLCKG